MGNSSVGKEKRLRIKTVKERDERILNPTSMTNCDLLKLPVIGDKIKEKSKNTIKFYFENLNGVHSGLWGTDKGRYFNTLMEKLEVDCFGAAETNLQWGMAQTSLIKLLDLKKDTKTVYA